MRTISFPLAPAGELDPQDEPPAARGRFGRRRAARRRRAFAAEAVVDGPRHHLVGVVGDAVRAGAVVVAGDLPIGGVGVAREPEDRAQHPGGGEDRVGGIERVGAAAVARRPCSAPRSSAPILGCRRFRARSRSASGRRSPRGRPGRRRRGRTPGSRSRRGRPSRRRSAARPAGRCAGASGGISRTAALVAGAASAEPPPPMQAISPPRIAITVPVIATTTAREDADRDQDESRSAATPGAHRAPPFRRLRLRRGGGRTSRPGSGRFSAGGFLARLAAALALGAKLGAEAVLRPWVGDAALRSRRLPCGGLLALAPGGTAPAASSRSAAAARRRLGGGACRRWDACACRRPSGRGAARRRASRLRCLRREPRGCSSPVSPAEGVAGRERSAGPGASMAGASPPTGLL